MNLYVELEYTPNAGALENKIPFDEILYAFTPSSFDVEHPSRVIKLVLFGGILERLN